MGVMASQITSLTIAYPTVRSVADQRKHQSSTSLVFVRGIHRSPVNSPRKSSVTRKMCPFDDVIMLKEKTWIMRTMDVFFPLSTIFGITNGAIRLNNYRSVTSPLYIYILCRSTRLVPFKENLDIPASRCFKSVVAAVCNGRTLGTVIFLHTGVNISARPVCNMCYVIPWKPMINIKIWYVAYITESVLICMFYVIGLSLSLNLFVFRFIKQIPLMHKLPARHKRIPL